MPLQIVWPSKQKLKYLIPIVIGLSLLAYSGNGFWQRYSSTHSSHPLPTTSTTVSKSTNKPDETPIKSDLDYQVTADQPRRILLPTINSQGFIQNVNLDNNHA